MTRRSLALLLLPLVLLLGGCMRMNMDMDIKNDKEVGVNLDFGINKAFASQGTKPITKDNVCSSTGELNSSKDLKGTPYEDDKFIGCRYAGTAKVAEMGTPGSSSLTLDKDVWTFKMKADNTETQGMSPAQVFSDFRVSINFPGKVQSHNGSSTVSGNKVTWTNPSDLFSDEGLVATASNKGGLPLIPILLGLLGLALLGGLLWFLLGRKKKPAVVAPATDPNAHSYVQPHGQPTVHDVPQGQTTFTPAGTDHVTGYNEPTGGYPAQPTAPYPSHPQPGQAADQQTYGQPGAQHPYGQAPGQQPYSQAPGQQPYGQPGNGGATAAGPGNFDARPPQG